MIGIDWHAIFQSHRIDTSFGTTNLWIGDGEPVEAPFRFDEFLPVFKILAAALVHVEAAKYIFNLPKGGVPWLKTWFGSVEFGKQEIVERNRGTFRSALGIDRITIETGERYELLTLHRENRAVQVVLRRLCPVALMEANASDTLRLETPSEKDTVNHILSNWDERRRTWDFGCFQDPVRWNAMLDIITTAIRALVRPESDIDFEFMFEQTGLTTFTRFSDRTFLVGAFLMLAIARYRPLHLVKARATFHVNSQNK